MNPVRSMTGFARARRATPEVEVWVAVKSVNHRGLDLHFHTPPELDGFEGAMRAAVKQRVARGHIDLRVSVHRFSGAAPLAVNQAMLASYVAAFRQCAEEHGLDCKPDLNTAFRLPGMLGDPLEEEPDRAFESLLTGALGDALDALNRFREREGAELVELIRCHNERISAAAAGIEAMREGAASAYHARLSERLSELLSGSAVDPQRLVQEAALLADRSDIGEETARLIIHSRQLDQLLSGGGEVGKKLDFLLQEMNRETNTILSKTGGIGEVGLEITGLALGAKSDIEKIREQSLNLE